MKKSIKRLDERISLGIIFGVFIIYSITLVFPFLWLAFNSVKGLKEFAKAPMALPVNAWKGLGNFATMFQEFDMLTMFYNTMFTSVVMTTLGVFCTCCTAYAYAKHEFKLKRALYVIGITPMMVSVAGTMPTAYKLMCDIGFHNNMYLWVLTAAGGFGVNFLLLGSVFQNISSTYREAAEMDGAGQWRIFLTIYMPQASGIITAMWILAFIGHWNDYSGPRIYIPDYETLSTGIYNLRTQITIGNSKYGGDYPKLFAGMLITVIPVVIIFIVFQEKIMNYSFGGGIKE